MSLVSLGLDAAIYAGTTTNGQKYYQIPKPKIDIRYLTETDDKLMNRMILSGKALVLEGDPMFSSDDSYCGCNCRCCFDQQAFGKTEE